MRAERLEALLWEKAEGTIPEPDLRQLEDYLVEHEHARLLEAEIVSLAESLAGVEQVDPPPSLLGEIERAVARRSVAPATWRHVATREWSVRLAYVAAGVLIGVLGLHLLAPGAVDRIEPSMLTGAMGGESPSGRVDLSGGRLSVSRDSDRLQVRWTVDGSAALELRLRPREGLLELEGVAHDGIRASRLVTTGGGVVVQATGPGLLELTARTTARSWPITITVTSEGEVVFDRSLRVEDL